MTPCCEHPNPDECPNHGLRAAFNAEQERRRRLGLRPLPDQALGQRDFSAYGEGSQVVDTIGLKDAIAAARGLAKMVREEFPAPTCEEIVNTWSCWDITAEEKQAVANLERAGLLDGS